MCYQQFGKPAHVAYWALLVYVCEAENLAQIFAYAQQVHHPHIEPTVRISVDFG